MTRNQFQRLRNYQDTVLAVYWLSEPDGIRCYASIPELAAETRLSRGTVGRNLARMAKRHVVMRAYAPDPDRPRRKALALLDHPDAFKYLRANVNYWGPLSLQAERNREREKGQATDPQASVGSVGVLES